MLGPLDGGQQGGSGPAALGSASWRCAVACFTHLPQLPWLPCLCLVGLALLKGPHMRPEAVTDEPALWAHSLCACAEIAGTDSELVKQRSQALTDLI